MLFRDQVEHAVRLQAYGYQLLRWLEKALVEGFIRPDAAGEYATSEDAAYEDLTLGPRRSLHAIRRLLNG